MSVEQAARTGRAPFAQGSLAQNARLISGLVLFAFALTHFVNHALGLISLDVMLQVQDWRRAVWRTRVRNSSPPWAHSSAIRWWPTC